MSLDIAQGSSLLRFSRHSSQPLSPRGRLRTLGLPRDCRIGGPFCCWTVVLSDVFSSFQVFSGPRYRRRLWRLRRVKRILQLREPQDRKDLRHEMYIAPGVNKHVAGDDREPACHVFRPDGHGSNHWSREGLDRGGDGQGQGRRHQSAERADALDDDQCRWRLRRAAAPGRLVPRTAEQSGFKNRGHLRRGAQRRSGAARRSATGRRQRHRDRGSAVCGDRARHRERERRPHHHREAGHRAAAQRPQLPAAAVPRRRRGRDRRRAGRHAPGCRQRDQHHGRPADLEQLHD